MNRYSPFYDPDIGAVSMSIDKSGSWVHINTVKKLQDKIELLENAVARYSEHSYNCRMTYARDRCTCGLEEVISSI